MMIVILYFVISTVPRASNLENLISLNKKLREYVTTPLKVSLRYRYHEFFKKRVVNFRTLFSLKMSLLTIRDILRREDSRGFSDSVDTVVHPCFP